MLTRTSGNIVKERAGNSGYGASLLFKDIKHQKRGLMKNH